MFLSNFNLYKKRFVLSILPLIIIIQSLSKWSKEEAIKKLNIPSDVPKHSDEKDYWTKLLASGHKIQEHLISGVIRRVFIDLPPPPDLKYNFDRNPPKITGQVGIPPIVDQLLGEKQNGFFIEAGALDGEAHSNTLFFELKRNYSGLLIEPSLEYPKLLKRNRKVTSVNACMATKDHPQVVEFYSYKGIGGIKGEVSGWASSNVTRNAELIRVVCLPLISILNAIGNPKIDYFSLDIEGAELAVLKTIPWEMADIKILSIEVQNNGRPNYGENVDRFMIESGYTKVLDQCCEDMKLDNVYVRNDLRSPLFKHDGKPRLMKEKLIKYRNLIPIDQ